MTLKRRLERLEIAASPSPDLPYIDRPPVETREQWLARRGAEMEWIRADDGWMVRMMAGRESLH